MEIDFHFLQCMSLTARQEAAIAPQASAAVSNMYLPIPKKDGDSRWAHLPALQRIIVELLAAQAELPDVLLSTPFLTMALSIPLSMSPTSRRPYDHYLNLPLYHYFAWKLMYTGRKCNGKGREGMERKSTSWQTEGMGGNPLPRTWNARGLKRKSMVMEVHGEEIHFLADGMCGDSGGNIFPCSGHNGAEEIHFLVFGCRSGHLKVLDWEISKIE
ncbi:hypothetical protein CPB85DRAFT_1254074 [Mucidula mucida]|nr:hypothetical protein CPB85DRAFT_1254074 [Mucidula mucida]